MNQARVLEQFVQHEQSVRTDRGRTSVFDLLTGQGIKHPGGNGNLYAIGECNDDTVRGLMAYSSDKLNPLPKEGMVGVTDVNY